MNLFSELGRRNVYRVVTAYIIVGWLIMQVVDVMAPALLLPEWIASMFAVLLLIGFPIAVLLSWVYDVTPEGVIRTDAADTPTSPAAARRLDALILAGLVAVGGLIVWQQLDRRSDADADYIQATSIAVLPFEDLSPAADQQYFADGIAEEILNELASSGSLKVSGRTSSFSFRGSDRTLTDIGEKLGVATVLEGSVRKQGERVRIDARLISARDGIMLWNDTFDTLLNDIFVVQDEIARQILAQLAEQIAVSDADPDSRAPAAFDAYDNFLRARDLVASRKLPAMQEAQRILDVTIALDPDYASALALQALVERLLLNAPGGMGQNPVATGLPKAIALAERALTLDPTLSDAHAVRGLLYLDQKDFLLGEASLRRAIQINPNNNNARLWLALCLSGKQQHLDVTSQLAALFEIDPLFTPVAENLVGAWLNLNQPEKAEAVIERLRRLEAPESNIAYTQAVLEYRRGNVAYAINALQPLYERQSSTTLAARLTFARLRIGDSDGSRGYPLPFIAIRTALLDGDYDIAVDRAAELLERSQGYFAFQIEYFNALAIARQDEQLIRYFKDNFANVSEFGEALSWPSNFTGLPPYAALASSLYRVGNQEDALNDVMQLWRRTIDIGRLHGGADSEYELNDAFWHALSGDHDKAISHIRAAAAIGNGLLGVPMQYEYLHELLAEHPEHSQLMAENQRRINEERTALGLSDIVL